MKANCNPRSFEYQVARLSLLVTFPPLALMLVLLYSTSASIYLKAILLIGIFCCVAFGTYLIWRRVRDQLRATTNVIEAVISGDSTMKANSVVSVGALAELNTLLNSASKQLAEQRLVSKEHHLAMAKVIEHIQVAVICVDHQDCITLVNPKAKQMFNIDDSLVGLPLDKAVLFEREVTSEELQQIVTFSQQGLSKRVYLQKDNYQLFGNNYSLYLFNDVQKLLQEEERLAWQKLLRVLRHEINNSLAPIASLGEALADLVEEEVQQGELKEDLSNGLTIINSRALALDTFIKEYETLGKLPKPDKSLFSLNEFISQQVSTFTSASISIAEKADIQIFADASQLSQVLTNLLKNAMQSNPDETCRIEIDWLQQAGFLRLDIIDNGQGISNPDNLFVPFYTTKKQGSGIGLVLSRQIMFNHGGDLTLVNNSNGPGATARIQLPVL